MEKKTTAAVSPDIMFVFQSSYKFPGFSMKKIIILFALEDVKNVLQQLKIHSYFISARAMLEETYSNTDKILDNAECH